MSMNKTFDHQFSSDPYNNPKERALIINKLKEYFPNVENLNIPEMFGNSQNIMDQIQQFVQNIPQPVESDNKTHMTMKQLCEEQEKKVFKKIQEVKQFDIYDEMIRLNPELDLKNLTMPQLSNKWETLQQRIKIPDQVSQTSEEQIEKEQELSSQMDQEFDDENSLSEEELANNFFKKLTDMSKCNKKCGDEQMPSRKFLDCNKIHNFLDEFDGPQNNRDWNILREIDINDGFNYKYLEFNNANYL